MLMDLLFFSLAVFGIFMIALGLRILSVSERDWSELKKDPSDFNLDNFL